MFLGIFKESSHSGNVPDPYSLYISIVAGSDKEKVEADGLPWLVTGKEEVG